MQKAEFFAGAVQEERKQISMRSIFMIRGAEAPCILGIECIS